jgi:hypothetical protein
MQAIARLAGPVVHGFKRGSKMLGWLVAAHHHRPFRRSSSAVIPSQLSPPHICCLSSSFDASVHQPAGPPPTSAPPTMSCTRCLQVLCPPLPPSQQPLHAHPRAGVYIGFATVAGQGPYKAAISVVRVCCWALCHVRPSCMHRRAGTPSSRTKRRPSKRICCTSSTGSPPRAPSVAAH